MNQDILAFAFQSIPLVGALVTGLLVAMSVVGAGALADKWSNSSKIAAILGIVLIGNALTVVLSGRVLHTPQEIALNPLLEAVLETDSGRGAWAGRLTNLVILFISLGEIVRWLTRQRVMAAHVKPLWLAFLAFYVASYWIGVLFATTREIQLGWIYAPITFTAMALLVPEGLKRDAFIKLEWVLMIVLAASLVGAAVLPAMTVERGYKGLIPGFSWRLYGVSDHANSLGIVAALAVILHLSPLVRKRPNLVFLAIAVAALIFTQSKTSWVVALVGTVFVRFESIRGRSRSSMPGQFALSLVVAGAALGVLGAVAFAVVANTGQLDRLLNFEEAVTFTGRTRIWEVSWNEFLHNPLFGYGPAIWDPLYRYQNNIIGAGQAHNQFFQTAGQAGLLGLTSLAVYIYLMGRNCARAWTPTLGLSGIAFIGLLIRCFSESPLRFSGLTGVDAFVHLFAFSFAAVAVAAPKTLTERGRHWGMTMHAAPSGITP